MNKRKFSAVLLLFLAAGDAAAQSNKPAQCPHPGWAQVLPSNADGLSEPAQQITQQKAAHEKNRQFWINTEKFITTWTELAHEYNEKGTFNMKKAREASRAFHALEHTEGWPRQ